MKKVRTKISLLGAVLSILVLSGLTNLTAADDCAQACKKFISCTEQTHKRKTTESEKKLLTKGCTESCTKHTDKVIECFKLSQQDGASCNAYSQCVVKYSQMMKGSKK
ncbi:MAG: Cys-rich protein [Leptospiraceae bacterium]|nr:Cys-rich protein [Leptospiraceae bacterium]MCP5511623.1 Cys-rich protein [Leptospiraceae bacterium]